MSSSQNHGKSGNFNPSPLLSSGTLRFVFSAFLSGLTTLFFVLVSLSASDFMSEIDDIKIL